MLLLCLYMLSLKSSLVSLFGVPLCLFVAWSWSMVLQTICYCWVQIILKKSYDDTESKFDILWATQQNYVGCHWVHGTARNPRIRGKEKGQWENRQEKVDKSQTKSSKSQKNGKKFKKWKRSNDSESSEDDSKNSLYSATWMMEHSRSTTNMTVKKTKNEKRCPNTGSSSISSDSGYSSSEEWPTIMALNLKYGGNHCERTTTIIPTLKDTMEKTEKLCLLLDTTSSNSIHSDKYLPCIKPSKI